LAKQNKLASAFLLGMDILLCSNSILFLTPSNAMGPDVIAKGGFKILFYMITLVNTSTYYNGSAYRISSTLFFGFVLFCIAQKRGERQFLVL
jgi:hypothetical protein